ncbi:MAG: hypothetical protein J6L76_05845, partial [Clostridia bacterium]|nr:hypothetical protein [Clostridia bacterium]
MQENTINREITIPGKTALVQENSFIGQAPETTALPSFTAIRHQLPQPVWEGHQDYIACYYRAWEIAFGN